MKAVYSIVIVLAVIGILAFVVLKPKEAGQEGGGGGGGAW